MEKVLTIQAARIGDLAQTARLLDSVRTSARSALAVDSSLTGLAELLYPGFDAFGLSFHAKPDFERLERDKKIFGRLRGEDFARVYNCNFSQLTASLCRLFPEERVLNYRPLRHSAGGILRSPWARLVFGLSLRRRFTPLNLVDFWGWLAPEPIPGASVNAPARPGGAGLGVVLAGRDSRRSLPEPVLANIINIVAGVLNPSRVLLFGSKTERPIGRRLTPLLSPLAQNKTENLAGRTDWPLLIENLKNLDLLLTPDTGLMHLAARLGTPVMAFFLSSAWCWETGPYGEGHLIWQAVADCAPCLEKEPCPHGLKCLEPFKSKEFYRNLVQYLKEGRIDEPATPGLLALRASFDNLGVKFEPVSGEDKEGMQREILRSLVKNWLKLDAEQFADAQFIRDHGDFLRDLFPETDWMLPRERYS